jgi:hypothetical protein
MPSPSSSFLSNRLALGGREFLGSRLSAHFPTLLPVGRITLRLAHRILSFANGDVEHLLGKLDGITRTFGHELSMPQAAPPIYDMRFQTEALPDSYVDSATTF